MLRLIILALLPLAIGLAQNSPSSPCPLTSAQVGSALGVTVLEAKPALNLRSGSITLQDCRYTLKLDKLEFTLMVKQTINTQRVTAQEYYRTLTGHLVPILHDPDGARFQEDQGYFTSPTLHYFRGGVGVELRILGAYYQGYKPSQAEFRTWQWKLLALPRIP